MRDFHNTAKAAAKDKNTPVLYQIARAYTVWRQTNNEPFNGADDEMAGILESAITANGVLQ